MTVSAAVCPGQPLELSVFWIKVWWGLVVVYSYLVSTLSISSYARLSVFPGDSI